MIDPTKIKYSDIISTKMQSLNEEFIDKAEKLGIPTSEFSISNLMKSLTIINNFNEEFKGFDSNLEIRMETCAELLTEFISHCIYALAMYRLDPKIKAKFDKMKEIKK